MTQTVETKRAAIVPATDERCTGRQLAHGARMRLYLSRFRTIGRQPVASAVILQPTGVRTLSASDLAFLRNSFAVASVVAARARRCRRPADGDATFSDAFDFPPAWLRIQTGLLIDTPAVLAAGPSESFCGHPASAYPFGDARVGDWDRPLLDALLSVWASSARGQSGAFRLRVSRVLEIAYVAMRAPMHNLRSGNDWGIVLALWVSCFETVANTGGSVSFDDVRAAIEGVPWPPQLRRRLAPYEYRSPARRHRPLDRMIRPVQVYARLYRARNMVLHGEPYERNRLEPGRRNRSWRPLHHEAAVVFRCVLLHFLAQHGHGDYARTPSAAEARRMGHEAALVRTVSARLAHRLFERTLARL